MEKMKWSEVEKCERDALVKVKERWPEEKYIQQRNLVFSTEYMKNRLERL